MPALVTKRYEQLLQQFINTVVARTGLNDITDSSVFKHLLAAPARGLDEVYYQLTLILEMFSLDKAVGEDLDERAAEVQPVGQVRIAAVKAVGEVVFGRSGTSGTVPIPVGTKVKTPSGLFFQTTAEGSIPNASTTSGPIAALAVEAGAAGNVAIGSITKFDNKPVGVETVTNPAAFVGGQDKETDDAFRERIKSYIRSLPRGTIEALEFYALGASLDDGQRVAYAHAVEDAVNRGEVTLYIDDGAGTAESVGTAVVLENLTASLGGPPSGNSALGGEVFLYTNQKPIRAGTFSLTKTPGGAQVLGVDYLVDLSSGQVKMTTALTNGDVVEASYTPYDGLIAEVQKIVDGDPADRENYPGIRAGGVRVQVLAPVVLQQLVVATVLVAEGYTKGTDLGGGVYTPGSVLEQVAQAISSYINNLGISGDVLRAELIAAIMGVPGVVNTSVTSPASDIVLLDEQLPRILTSNITLT